MDKLHFDQHISQQFNDDLEELVAYADAVGVRPVLSTNGTLTVPVRAKSMNASGS